MSSTDESTPDAAARDVGVTLSGGGSRATVFGLGALLAVADAGLRERTASISSVSGGSIANGAVMVGPDFGTAPAAEVEAHIAQAVKSLADRGMLLGGAPATRWYLRAFIASAVITVASLIAVIVGGIFRSVIVVGIGAALFIVFGLITLWLLSERSARTEGAIDKELLGAAKTTLADQQARDLSVHHVICTTELQGGTTFYLSNRMVYGWEFGGTTRKSIVPLSIAVQASACVPGAFNARSIRLDQLNLTPGSLTADDHPARPHEDPVDRIVVVDGGVYDNMADSWEYGFDSRAGRWKALRDVQSDVRELIVVNASADWNRLNPLRSRGLMLEKDSLMRSQGVQYDVSTSHRRQALYDVFTNPNHPDQLAGVFVQIKDNPYRLARIFSEPEEGQPPGDQNRWAGEALEFLERYGVAEDAWNVIAKASSRVATTLAPLGTDVCASLLEHGYMLTTANLHVIFGYGDMSRPVDRERFTRLAKGLTSAS